MTYPSDKTTERAALVALIASPKALDDTPLTAAHFHEDAHRSLFSLIADMRRNGQPIDSVTLPARVSREPNPEQFGGIGYACELTSDHAQPGSLPHYVREIIADHTRREVMACAEVMTARAQAGRDDAGEVLQDARQALAEIQAPGDTGRWISLADALYGAAEEARAVAANEVPAAMPLGFDRLDLLLGGGGREGQLMVLAARPSMGKTAAALQVAIFAAQLRYPTGVASLEMSALALALRRLSASTAIKATKIRTGDLDAGDLAALLKAAEHDQDYPLWIDEKPGQSVQEIAAQARRLDRLSRSQGKGGLRLLVVDYLQLMTHSSKRGENHTVAVGKTSAGLKAIAKELGCTVLALSQLSRACEARDDKRPMMSDLRDSGAIEQDADVIWFIYRESKYKETEHPYLAEFIVSKQRQGPTGTIPMAWIGEQMRFEDLSNEGARQWASMTTKPKAGRKG